MSNQSNWSQRQQPSLVPCCGCWHWRVDQFNLKLNFVFRLDEYLSPSRRKSHFSLLPPAWYITKGVCNEESSRLINPVCSSTACCCTHSRADKVIKWQKSVVGEVSAKAMRKNSWVQSYSPCGDQLLERNWVRNI